MTLARHGYFVLQTRAETVGGSIQLTGVVENLATGDKWTFHDVSELSGLLTQWGWRVFPSAPPATGPGGR